MAEEESGPVAGLDDAWTEQELNLEADQAIGLQAFIRHVNTLKVVDEETGVNGFTREFVSLRRSDDEYKRQKRFPSEVGTSEVNRKKNRYKDIVPFDHARCVLPELDGQPGTDYINASFLKVGEDLSPAIAAQGPLTTTVDDYWRMVWHYNVRIIIMCAKVVEAGKQKCAKYWPDAGSSKTCGSIEITNTNNEEVGEDFNINTLTVSNGGETRTLHHFHYTAWPDHGVPKSPESVLELLRRVRAIQPALTPHIVIHCSAGCGRTGTIAAIDALWYTLRHDALEAKLDIFETIARFRQQRVAMVQTMDQYLFVYKTLLDLVKTVLDRVRNYSNGDSDSASQEPMYANLPGGLSANKDAGAAPPLPAPRGEAPPSAATLAAAAAAMESDGPIYANLGAARQQTLPKEEDPLTQAAATLGAPVVEVRRQTIALGKQRLKALQELTLPSMDKEMDDEPADFEKYVENPEVSEPAQSPTRKTDANLPPIARGRRYSLSDKPDMQFPKRVSKPRGAREIPASWPKFRIS